MLDKLLQPEKARSSMLVTPSGIVMLDSPLQYWKAWFPMLVTLSGIVMLDRLLQPEKEMCIRDRHRIAPIPL